MFMPKITHKNKIVSRVFTAVAIAMTISACEVSSTAGRKQQPYDITAPVSESSGFYMQKASAEPTARADWLLLAAKAFIKENNLNEANNVIVELSKMPLLTEQLIEWQLVRAELLLLANNPQAALNTLKFDSAWHITPAQWQRYFLLQYNAYNSLKDINNTIIALINLEPYVKAGQEQHLSNLTWNTLSLTSTAELEQLSQIKQQTLTAWVELLSKLRKTAGALKKQQVLDEWLATNSNHLGARFLPEKLLNLNNFDMTMPKNIGVILPLSKKFAIQGETIRNGLVQALINDKTTNPKPEFSFYDTNAMSMAAIIQDMKAKSVEFVIGPLQKGKIEEFIQKSQGEFRHLALNIPSNDFLNSGSCFFTLSPEQEAAQAANRIAKKHKYPVVIAPNNDLGKRTSAAFAHQWQAKTGRKANIEYFTNSSGMQQAVSRAMGITKSRARANELNKYLGTDMVTEARSRRDVDAIYLIAGSGELTLLKPFIEISINPGEKIPKLYASSRSNNQARGIAPVSELNGIEFSDIPLLVKPSSAEAQKFYQLWPDMNNNMSRLYALGMDSYSLIKAIPQMQIEPTHRHDGQTGTLYLNEPCTVNRIMSWAVYTPSGAKPVE